MVFKSISALSMYLVPYVFMIISVTDHLLTLFILWIIMGIGKAFVGTSVMHDALHGTYSRKRSLSLFMNWWVHQLKTTTNFGMQSKLLFWFSGGLNHQIEHHLFPHICHIHYRHISKNVQSTAIEYGLPYHTQTTLGGAVYHHLKMLRGLGTGRI